MTVSGRKEICTYMYDHWFISLSDLQAIYDRNFNSRCIMEVTVHSRCARNETALNDKGRRGLWVQIIVQIIALMGSDEIPSGGYCAGYVPCIRHSFLTPTF